MEVTQSNLFLHLQDMVYRIGKDFYFDHGRYPKMKMTMHPMMHAILMHEAPIYAPMDAFYGKIPDWLNNIEVWLNEDVNGVLLTFVEPD